jgi:hypothetical protein
MRRARARQKCNRDASRNLKAARLAQGNLQLKERGLCAD